MGENDKLFAAFVEVIKVLVNDELDIRKKREMDERDDFSSRRGLRWTAEEEERLDTEFKLAVRVISYLHKRDQGGINAKLEKMYQGFKLCQVD